MAAMSTAIAPGLDSPETESEIVILPPESPVHILSVSQFAKDHAVLRKIINRSPWRMANVENTYEAMRELQLHRYEVVFCECFLPDGTWKDVLDLITLLDERPLLVVTSQFADEPLWAEVLNLGGYDVLSKPLIEDEVRRVLLLALSHRTRPARPRVLRKAS